MYHRQLPHLTLATRVGVSWILFLLIQSPWDSGAAYARGAGKGALVAEAAGQQRRISLADALGLARKNNRLLRVARARIGEAKGRLTQASVLLVSNPVLGVGVGPRFMAASRGRVTVDVDAHLEQALELGGQRRHRKAVATARLHAVRATVQDTRRVIDLAVALLYYRALAARQRVRLLRENAKLAAALLKSAGDRVAQGAGNQLDLNASRLLVAEANRRVLTALSRHRALLTRLSTVCGLPGRTRLRLHGALPVLGRSPGSAALIRRALRLRPELAALRHRISSAHAAVRLARASAWPDLTLGVSYAREESSNAVLFTLKFALPLFNRRQGQRARALARLRRVRAERSAARQSIAADVRLTWASHLQTIQMLKLYSGDVLTAQRATLRLLRRSFAEGNVSYVKVLAVQRQLLAGRQGYLKARLAHAEALARLRAAAGISQTTTTLP